ncbi:MAG: tetratricopeptide repeat protein [Bacteroidales bacterium]
MKSLILKGVLALFLVILAQTEVLGQNGRFGNTPEDSIRALRNLSLFSDRYRQGNFEEAMPYWRVVFKEFPRASLNTYIWGQNLMSHHINNANSDQERQAYLDTAMMMFDQRIENFGDPANVLGRKGLFYFEHNSNIDEAGPGYEALEEAIKLSGATPSHAVVFMFMQVTVAKFNAGLLDNEQVIETYSSLMETLDNVYKKSPSDDLQKIRGMVEGLFADSGAADCDALIRLFGEQVNNSPEDVELLNKVNDLLSNAKCTDSDLYLTVTEKIHQLDPSPRSALNLVSMYQKRDENDQVVNYLKQAIELQDDDTEKASYYLELAFLANQVDKNKQLSRQYAQEALKHNPSLGRAHIHIGSLYASEQSCFNDPFKDRTVFWVAVDRFNEAKRVDPDLTAEANRLIETYSKYFPDNETIFFQELTAGQSYRVECWINETTRVRPN